MSTHEIKVVRIENIRKHPDADKLSIIDIKGWSVVAQTGMYHVGDKAVYIEPDYVVPLTGPFAFLKKPFSDNTHHRVRAIKLRGQVSVGLLIPLPETLHSREVGDCVMEDLGIVRYEPPVIASSRAEPVKGPDIVVGQFALENIENYGDALVEGEPVVVTEKIDGANARYVCIDGHFYVGSRNRWVDPEGDSWWAVAARADKNIEAYCRANQGFVLYGEVFGPVQDLKYGRSRVEFAAFAVLELYQGWTGVDAGELYGSHRKHEWMNYSLFASAMFAWRIKTAPVLYRGPYKKDIIALLAEQDSVTSYVKQLSEGVVVIPEKERTYKQGRLALKKVSTRYLLG